MATRFEASPLAADAAPVGPRWRRLLAPSPAPSRHDIERDAAARLGVPVGLIGDGPATKQATTETGGVRRPGGLKGRLRRRRVEA